MINNISVEQELRENSKKPFDQPSGTITSYLRVGIPPEKWNLITAFRKSNFPLYLVCMILAFMSGLIASLIAFYYYWLIGLI